MAPAESPHLDHLMHPNHKTSFPSHSHVCGETSPCQTPCKYTSSQVLSTAPQTRLCCPCFTNKMADAQAQVTCPGKLVPGSATPTHVLIGEEPTTWMWDSKCRFESWIFPDWLVVGFWLSDGVSTCASVSSAVRRKACCQMKCIVLGEVPWTLPGLWREHAGWVKLIIPLLLHCWCCLVKSVATSMAGGERATPSQTDEPGWLARTPVPYSFTLLIPQNSFKSINFVIGLNSPAFSKYKPLKLRLIS